MKDYWEENNIEKPQQVIVCAACKIDTNGEGENIVLCGARHWDNIMRVQARAMGYKTHAPESSQGFINQFGEFLTRKEALEIATVNWKLFNNLITYAESLRLIFAIRKRYQNRTEQIITNQNTDVIK